LSLDTPMDLAPGTGKKRRNSGGISFFFAEAMRKIGGVYGGRAMNQRFPKQTKMPELIGEYKVTAIPVMDESDQLADLYVAEGIISSRCRDDNTHIATASWKSSAP
jgi:hypothetical protein